MAGPKTKIDNRKDILLLMLYCPGKNDDFNEPISGRTRLVKMLFLFKEEAWLHFKKGNNINIDEDNFYQFFPWNFGPFSRDIYDDLNFFIFRGFISQQDSEEETMPESAAEWEQWLTLSGSIPDEEATSEYDEQVFSLTDKGCQYANKLYEQMTVEQRRLLKAFKSKCLSKPLRALLKYIYENYDQMTIKSKIRDQVLCGKA